MPKAFRVRHPAHSFNFAGKGEWYFPADALETKELQRRFPDIEIEYVDVEEEPEPVGAEEEMKAVAEKQAKQKAATLKKIEAEKKERAKKQKEAEAALDAETDAPSDPSDDEVPVKCGGAWWQWKGKKYYFKDLPAEAKKALE